MVHNRYLSAGLDEVSEWCLGSQPNQECGQPWSQSSECDRYLPFELWEHRDQPIERSWNDGCWCLDGCNCLGSWWGGCVWVYWVEDWTKWNPLGTRRCVLSRGWYLDAYSAISTRKMYFCGNVPGISLHPVMIRAGLYIGWLCRLKLVNPSSKQRCCNGVSSCSNSTPRMMCLGVDSSHGSCHSFTCSRAHSFESSR